MALAIGRHAGMLLLGIYLILVGLSGLVSLPIGPILPILALLAGILILAAR